MPLLGGRLCEVAYTNSLLPLLKCILLQSRGGAWVLVPLSYASDSGAARICQRGPKQGSEATERGEVVGGFPPSHGRKIFENSCMKTTFSCTLTPIIMGILFI